MTPEPTEPTCWARGPCPNIDQNGSWTCWTPRAETLTTAGAAVRTTGAKLDFIAMASPGATRLSANTPSWARLSVDWPRVTRIRATARVIVGVFMVI